MANHAHRQIRDAIVTALTGLSSTGSRVHANRLYPIPEGSLPALRVSLDDETVEAQTVHVPTLLGRTLTLVVECCAQAKNDTQDDTCDQMQKEVEVALASGFTVSSKTLVPILAASRYDDEAGELDAAVKRLEFRLQFFTLSNAPDALV